MEEKKPKQKRRGRGEGSISKRADGRWQGRVTLPDGKRKSVYARSKEALITAMQKAREEARTNSAIDPSAIRTGDWLQEWLDNEPTLRPSSKRIYQTALDIHVKPAIGHVRLQRVNELMVDRLIASLKPSAAHSVRNILRPAFNKAILNRIVDRNPTGVIKLQRVEPKPVAVWNEKEIVEFVKATAGHKWQSAFLLACCCGMRIGEVIALKWDAIDLEDRTVSIDSTQVYTAAGREFSAPKTKASQRVVRLPRVVVDSLHERRKTAFADGTLSTGWVFVVRGSENPIWQHTLRKSLDRLLKKHGIRRVKFHAQRHAAATMLILDRQPMKAIAEMLGHSSAAITLHTYSHVFDEHRQQLADSMDGRFASAMASVKASDEAKTAS